MNGTARWFNVRHETRYDYALPVERAYHVAYLRPRATVHQQVRGWNLAIDPPPDDGAAQDGFATTTRASLDFWGNYRFEFWHTIRHSRMAVVSTFQAAVTAAAAPDPQRGPAWEQVARRLHQADAAVADAMDFAKASTHAPIHATLATFARAAFTPGCTVAGGALNLMRQIHGEFLYEPRSTHVGTSATEALALRRGVCQDYAHVMIGACRSIGLAARYVSGYLQTCPPAGQSRLVGADASHAWVEVWCPEQGWLALDATNAMPASGGDHVSVAWGRDYADVAPLSGVIHGGGLTEPVVSVTVQPVAA